MENQQTKEFYDFGEFRLDARNRLLWYDGKTVPLTVKEFEVLFFFIENAGNVVGKEQLLEAIWKDTFIEEATMMQNISRLRRKLEAASSGEKYIETLPKRGYRFLPTIIRNDEDALVIEEQTVQHLRVEERVEILSSPAADGVALIKEDAGKFLETENVSSFTRNSNLLNAAPTAKSRLPYLWISFGLLVLTAANFIAYRLFFYSTEPKVIPVKRIIPFSGLPGRESQPAFSQDGKQMAFTWNGGEQEGDNTDIYLKLVGAGNPVRLTDKLADEVSPAFAPDGKTIAFVRLLPGRGELLIIPALGGGERKVCDLRRSFSSISFAPDGRSIAVYDNDGSGQGGIFLVDVETGGKRRLTAPPELTTDDQPAFAPDGQSIAFVRSFAQSLREIFVVSAAGGEPRQLTFDRAWLGGLAWSADGERIFFTSRRKYNGRSNLWQIAARGSDSPEVIATGSERLGTLAVSPDKRTIAFVEESYDTNIWRVEPEKTEREAFRKFVPSSRSDNSPNISPDGARVVFASSRTGKYEIWIADMNGSNVRQLTDFPNGQVGSPRFSPDGNWIAFDAQSEGNGDIYVVSANGGAARRITDAASFDYIPAWSADGGSIYFVSNRSGKAQIYKIPATGGEAAQITINGGADSFESPDGKFLYYRKGGGSAELWRVSTGGGNEQVVSELSKAGYWRSWALIKTGIYFIQYSENPPYKLMFYDFSKNLTREILTTDNAPISVYPGLGVSEDGKTIFYVQNDQNASSIMLAEVGI